MWGCGGGILLSSPTVWWGQGEGGGTHTGTHTHTGTYTQMFHLPFSDLPLKKCPRGDKRAVFVKGSFWRMCPRSGFRSGGTCERTVVPGFVLGEHLNLPSFRSDNRKRKGKESLKSKDCSLQFAGSGLYTHSDSFLDIEKTYFKPNPSPQKHYIHKSILG